MQYFSGLSGEFLFCLVGAGAGVLAEWPLLVTRIGLAVTVLGGLLLWIARTARLRLPHGQALENNVASHWGVILAVTVAVLCLKTILGGVLLYVGGEPIGRAIVSSLITPQIGEFSFVLTTTGVASGIFISQEADFLLAVIAASLFVSLIWSNVLHYLVVRSKIHRLGEPTKLSNAPS